ncbi:TDT family transporter [Paraburkholderia fungorum]|uniref:TDT family transporter n=1 Tax=Paraburkholderia fungorum TaxID=134537 RepID=UPI0020921568|nr:TDT family transporter [Paraburkholderia fungorum]USU18522.1 TDT family transporter [Paraburkholderia fungorum]USU26415.1 TDT family transporter [Paraburkholderia fungorum]
MAQQSVTEKPTKSRFAPFRHVSRNREIVRQFTPNWFALTMGTGIVFLILLALPFQLPGQHQVAETLWMIDSLFFATFSVLFIARLIRFPETVQPMLDHPIQSMFLGAIPMGLIPIVNGLSVFGVELLGPGALSAAHALWWVDAGLAVLIACLVPYRMFTTQKHSTEQMTAVWLLPIVAPEVTASSAGVLAPHLSHNAAQLLVGTGYVLWAISVPLAFSILTIVFLRLALHKLPHRDMAASSWLTLGPIGTGSLGLLLLGQAAPAAFAGTPLAQVAVAARDFGLLGGLLLWGVGVWWLVIAVILTIRYQREGMTFNMGWWGFTFPIGVYTATTFTLHRLTQFFPFAVIGTVLTVALIAFWLIVVSKTLKGMWNGNLFQAPCLVKPNK